MKELIKLSLWGILLLAGSIASGQAIFIENKGQWSGDFQRKLELSAGAVFFSDNHYRVALVDVPHSHSQKLRQFQKFQHQHQHPNKITAFEVQFVGAKENGKWESNRGKAHPRNYFLGSNKGAWQANVASSFGIEQSEIYPGVLVEFHGDDGELKYNFHLAPKADPSLIKMQYNGVENLQLVGDRLLIETAIGKVWERIPESYQMINGKKKLVSVSYVLEGNTVRFKVGKYQTEHPLIIDPSLDFSTFSGSTDLNFGNSATYGEGGTMYGAGVNFGVNYPTTLGAFQTGFAGDSIFNVDVTISKFSPDGQQLLYATYLGGRDIEVVHSLISDEQGNLILLGNTGSDNFPLTNNAFQKVFGGGDFEQSFTFNNFDQGSDIFISKLSSDGSQLLASTYWGGSKNDGFNRDLYYNYGDHYRGEVYLTENDEILVVSNTFSMDVPMGTRPNGGRNQNSQDALIGLFSADLSQNLWGTYFGGLKAESGYGIRSHENDVFITGGTDSEDLPTNPTVINDRLVGNIDGYLARFDLQTGSFRACTYFGTPAYDQSFFLDLDYNGDLYITGQSKGNLAVSPGVYNNPNSTQFVAKIDTSLKQVIWQTTVGSSQNKQDLVPSAFMVDQCQNIYLSGWNGASNMVGFPGTQNGNTLGLPTTGDAYQANTDGSDFYFLILGHNANRLAYASYLGGNDNEHVDGGTSRFNKDGTIYQAVCSNCNNLSFPTTPAAYSANAGGVNCNMAVFKFSFNQILSADARISFSTENDSICDGLIVNLNNRSLNATNYRWDFGNGDSSYAKNPQVVYRELGNYEIRLIAFDTICQITDTAYLQINHTTASAPSANFMSDYIPCDSELTARFDNLSLRADAYLWDFGDGVKMQGKNVTHQFPAFGSYEVMLIAQDTLCQRADTIYKEVSFTDSAVIPDIRLNLSECSNGALEVDIRKTRPWLEFEWEVDGRQYFGPSPKIKFNTTGLKQVLVSVVDTLCKRNYSEEFQIEVSEIRGEVYSPTAFTPNGDGLNDSFEILGDPCEESASLRIFSRWGQLVYQTERPFEEFWDGTINGEFAPPGVYTFILLQSQEKTNGSFTLYR